MVDATTVAVIIVFAVIVLGIVMFIMICKQTKQQFRSIKRISKRELRRKSRICSIALSHRHSPHFAYVSPRNGNNIVSGSLEISSPESRGNELPINSSASNPDNTSDTSLSRGGEESQSVSIPVSVPSPCHHEDPTHTIKVEVKHASPAPQAMTESRNELMYDYKPTKLPPINPADVQHRYPDETRGSDVTC